MHLQNTIKPNKLYTAFSPDLAPHNQTHFPLGTLLINSAILSKFTGAACAQAKSPIILLKTIIPQEL